MTQDIIDIVNEMGKEEKVRDGIQFLRIDGGATITDLYTADVNDEDSCASDKDYESDDKDMNASDDDLSDNEEWVEDDDLPESEDDVEQSEDEYDINNGMASDVSLNIDVDEGDNDVASEHESEESDHESQGNDLLNEDQVESGLNIVETDNDEDNDDFEDKINTPPTSPDTQQRDRKARLQRRNADNDDSTSNTSTVQPKRRMVDRLKSDLNPKYWSVNCHTVIDQDGTLFAMMVAEQAGLKIMQEYFELEASKSTPMYGY